MKRLPSILLFAPLAAVLVACDRASKGWAQGALAGTLDGGSGAIELESLPIRLTLVHNTGAAFGLGEGSTSAFIAIAAVIVCVIAIWLLAIPRHSPPEVVSLSLIAAGGIGNLIDRIVCGYVVDFIEFTFIDFPVFNVADICVTTGVALFIICVIFLMFRPAPEEAAPEEAAPEEAAPTAWEDSAYDEPAPEEAAPAAREDSAYDDTATDEVSLP